jgi:hypothetical protein
LVQTKALELAKIEMRRRKAKSYVIDVLPNMSVLARLPGFAKDVALPALKNWDTLQVRDVDDCFTDMGG